MSDKVMEAPISQNNDSTENTSQVNIAEYELTRGHQLQEAAKKIEADMASEGNGAAEPDAGEKYTETNFVGFDPILVGINSGEKDTEGPGTGENSTEGPETGERETPPSRPPIVTEPIIDETRSDEKNSDGNK